MKKEELDRTDKSKAVQDNSSFFIIIAFIILSSSLNRHNFFIFLCQKFFQSSRYIYRVLSEVWLPHSFARLRAYLL